MKLNYPRLAFAIFMSAFSIPSITAQVSTPAYEIIDLGAGIPWAVASNGMMVIDRGFSPTNSFYRYKAGVDELLGGDQHFFQFHGMNDRGDIAGVLIGPGANNGPTAAAIKRTDPANSVTLWTQTGNQTGNPGWGSSLTAVNENLTVTGSDFSYQQTGNVETGSGTSFISSAPFSLTTLASSSYMINRVTEESTDSGQTYSFRDLNNNGAGVGRKYDFDVPGGLDSPLYYGITPQPSGDSDFDPWALNDQNLVAGPSNEVLKLWEPATGTFHTFALPNPLTIDSFHIRVTDPPLNGPDTPTFILAGDNLIIRTWKDVNGNPSSEPIHTILAASQLIPAGSSYTDVALKDIANNGIIAATAHKQGDNFVHAILLLPPGLATSYLKPNDLKLGGDKYRDCGMAQFSAHAMQASLNIGDTPIHYSPPLGPAIDFTITYNQREKQQPATFDYSNLGPNWTFNWHSYIVDDPAVQALITTVYVPGGGAESYTFDYPSQTFARDPQSHAALVRVGPTYEKVFPDGSKHVYGLRDGATTYPRRVFLTQMVDAIGNAVTVHYFPKTTKIEKIVDPLNQETNFFYEDLADPYKITKVTDPFLRSVLLGYSNGKLTSATDPVGIVSAFTYKPGTNFIELLTTPYGATAFETGESGTNRWLNMVDVTTGAVERVEYRDNAPGIGATDPSNQVPSGFTNTGLDVANTFYWDKKAMLVAPGDYTKARITHWAKNLDGTPSGIVASEKAPLEYRVWLKYEGQTDTNHTGPSANPIEVARVLADASEQRSQYTYNSIGKKTRAIDPVGRVTSYSYDPSNEIDLIAVFQRNPAGASMDPDEPADLIFSSTYTDTQSHLPHVVTDAAGQTTTYTYTTSKQLGTVTNAKDEITTYEYGDGSAGKPVGYLTKIISPSFPSLNGSSATKVFTYDEAKRVRTVTNSPDNYTVTTDYDDLDRKTRVTYPDTTYEEFQYIQEFGQGPTTILDLTGSRDRLGRWTYRLYNSNRQMTSITDPANRTTQYEWCTCGTLTSITDPKDQTTTFNRDLQGRVYQKVFANNSTINYLFEGQPGLNTEGATSRLKSMTDALNQTTEYQYFTDNNLEQVSYPNAQNPTASVNYTYDPNHNRIATMDDGTGHTEYHYYTITSPPSVNSGRMEYVNGPLGDDTITFTYDELGRTHDQSINGAVKTVTYDSLGRLDTTTNPLGSFTRIYDGVTPRLQTLTYPNGQTANYVHFPENNEDRRLQTLQNVAGGAVNLSQFGYTYDDEGQLTSWSSLLGGTASGRWFDYDNARQLLGVRNASDENDATKVFIYQYDDAGNRTYDGVANIGPHHATGESHNYTLNNVNQIDTSIRATLWPHIHFWPAETFSYDAAGNMTYDGDKMTFEWDAANRLSAINYLDSGARTEFGYDGLGRRVKITEIGPGVTATIQPVGTGYAAFTTEPFTLPAGSYTITFEGLNTNGGNVALIDAVSLNNTLVANGSFESPDVSFSPGLYEFNPSGATWSFTGTSGIAFNGSDFTSKNSDAPDGSQVAFIQNEGNASQVWTAAAGTYTLGFQAAQGGSNGSDQQVRVIVRPSSAAVTVKTFVWCGNQICEERDSTGTTVTKRFFREGEQRIGGSDAGNYYYTRDHLGSIREVTDAGGALRGQYDYDPYGKAVVVTGDMNVDFGYTGHYFHAPSGLNLARYRAYHPELGRWLSRDPIEEEGGLNLYGYVENNPVNLLDPLGLYDHSPRETSRIINDARRAAKAGPVMGLINLARNHGPFGRYDFKANNPEIDTFAVGGRRLNTGQFGNYLAGYAGASYGGLGYAGMRGAGIAIDMLDGGPTYFDDDGSADDINWGMRDAILTDLLEEVLKSLLNAKCPGR